MATYLPGKFIWREHASGDPAQAQAFYHAWLGWGCDEMPMSDGPYQIITNAGAGIGGYRATQPGEPANWTSYISSEDVDKTYAAALAAGAKSCLPPTDFTPAGRGATVIDPTGAPISFWKSSQGDHPDVTRLPDHHFCWNELWTADEKAALAFYESVFGYTHDTMPMGAAGDYYILKTSEGRAGIMRSQPPQPTLWVPYVLVADTDALAAKAQGLGAKIVVPPADIPNMGRFAILIDPSGATIAIFKPAAR